MDRPALDERLPTLYRAILEAASELEKRGMRAAGLRARRRATRDYTTWNERAERRLTHLLDDLRRQLEPPSHREGLIARFRVRARRPSEASSVIRPTA